MASLFVSACDNVPKGKKARWAVLPAHCRLQSSPCKCLLINYEALGAGGIGIASAQAQCALGSFQTTGTQWLATCNL